MDKSHTVGNGSFPGMGVTVREISHGAYVRIHMDVHGSRPMNVYGSIPMNVSEISTSVYLEHSHERVWKHSIMSRPIMPMGAFIMNVRFHG